MIEAAFTIALGCIAVYTLSALGVMFTSLAKEPRVWFRVCNALCLGSFVLFVLSLCVGGIAFIWSVRP